MIGSLQRQAVIREGRQLFTAHKFGILVRAIVEGTADIRLTEEQGLGLVSSCEAGRENIPFEEIRLDLPVWLGRLQQGLEGHQATRPIRN
jgi:hypothetical protein